MVSYGYSCRLEALIDEKWYIVPLKENHCFPAVKITMFGHAKNDFPVYLEMFECYPGKHRIILEAQKENTKEDGEMDNRIILSCEFDLF